MKKLIMSIKRVVARLFKKDKTTHVSTYEELLKALQDQKKKITLDNGIDCADSLVIDHDVTIFGDGQLLCRKSARTGFAFSENTILSNFYIATSRVQHEDGSSVKQTEKGKGIFRIKTHLDEETVKAYQYINFSCGWTAYNWPITKFEDGFIYFRSYGTDYCCDYDYYQGNSKKSTEYRLIKCEDTQYSKFLITVKNKAKLTLKHLHMYGGIDVIDGNLTMDYCFNSNCTEHAIQADDDCTVCISDGFFENIWKSAIKTKGDTFIGDSTFSRVNQSRMNAGAIDCEGDVTIRNNYLLNYGCFGIRVGKVKATEEDQCPDVVVDNNTLETSVNQGVVTDTGAIYLAANNYFAKISNNKITDYQGRGNNHAIYCDDGAYNFSVTGNKICNCPTGYAISSRCADPTKTNRGYVGGEPNTNRLIKENYCESGIWFGGNADVADNQCIYHGNTVLEYTDYKTLLQNVAIK